MKFRKIDISTWDRSEHYTWFTKHNRCKINMTMQLDVTNLIKTIKQNKLRCYPVFAYITSKILNRHDEFKMNYDKNGNLGVYDVIHPRYPIFHDSDKRISILWTDYSEDFRTFYGHFISDVNEYGENRSMSAKGEFPHNCFDVSCLPWSSFTSFDCPPTTDTVWLPPFIMVGKFFKNGEKFLLPVSLSVHHAACDGYHVSKFFEQFQDLAADFAKLI
ncbi:MAG: chloramphenicol acetyltransferase [Clostridia bacterium]|nr:chloramphenicol acetyltransferase [Clostridia bacterium]